MHVLYLDPILPPPPPPLVKIKPPVSETSEEENSKLNYSIIIESYFDYAELLLDKDEVQFGERIGQGSFGVVYRGELKGKVVALKSLPFSEEMRTPIMREINILRYAINIELSCNAVFH